MNPSTGRALDQLLKKMARPSRRRRGRFSVAPVYLGLGMVVGYQLLARFVPEVWGSLLPGGLARAPSLRGWPALIWHLTLACHDHFPQVVTVLGGVGLGGLVVSTVIRPLRFLVWLAAIGTIGLDAAIVYVTLTTAIRAMSAVSGIG